MRQRSAFDNVRDDAVDIRCECGKRLAWMWLIDDLSARGAETMHQKPDGAELVKWERAYATPPDSRNRHGILNLGREDWRRVVCPKCRRDWRGSTVDLVAIIRSAQLRRSDRATLRKSSAADWAEPRSARWS